MPDPPADLWEIDPAAIPSEATLEERVRYAIAFAVLAPSSHNTQPWRFRVADNTIEVHADRSRRLPVVDPEDRALVISCGAAIFILQLALRALGLDCHLRPASGGADDLLATVVITGDQARAGADEQRMLEAVPDRRTNRLEFESRALEPSVGDRLVAAAETEGSWLEPIVEPERKLAVARLVAEGDELQFGDGAFRAELSHWIRHPHRGDGIPPHATGRPDLAAPIAARVIRTFDLGRAQAKLDLGLADGSPLLAVIGTSEDQASRWLAAGAALARVLLTAQSAGVSASFLNQPIEVPALRPRLAALVGRAGSPQLLLRFGYGKPLPPAPRRPLKDVLESPADDRKRRGESDGRREGR